MHKPPQTSQKIWQHINVIVLERIHSSCTCTNRFFFFLFFIFHSFPVLVPVNLSPPFLTVEEMGITRFRLASVHQCEVASTPHSELYTDLPRSQWWVWCIFAYNLKGTQKNPQNNKQKKNQPKSHQTWPDRFWHIPDNCVKLQSQSCLHSWKPLTQ